MLLPHAGNHPLAESSANAIVPSVMDLLAPQSVLDVGCGAGAWASAFIRAGVDDVTGVDAAWARPSLLITSDRFVEADLTRSLDLGRRFDMAVALEVAEHLPSEVAEVFVGSLCAHADLVLFSAAPPGQAGPGHVNMRWPSYWAELFSRHGLYCADVFRFNFWHDDGVAWWYRQNLLLFGTTLRLESCGLTPASPLDIAHPALVRSLQDRPATLDQVRKGATLHLIRRPASRLKRSVLRLRR